MVDLTHHGTTQRKLPSVPKALRERGKFDLKLVAPEMWEGLDGDQAPISPIHQDGGGGGGPPTAPPHKATGIPTQPSPQTIGRR